MAKKNYNPLTDNKFMQAEKKKLQGKIEKEVQKSTSTQEAIKQKMEHEFRSK